MTLSELSAARALKRVEERIGLLARCTPTGIRAVEAELTAAWEAGTQLSPTFRYRPAVDFSPEQRALQSVLSWCRIAGMKGRWFAERVGELELEIRLVEKVGTKGFVELAANRFPSPSTAEVEALRPLVASGLASRVAVHSTARGAASEPSAGLPRSQSDDARDPKSLLCVLSRRIGELRLAARVVPNAELLSLAAVGRDCVFVATNRLLGPVDVERTALHEVCGHLRGRLSPHAATDPILLCGCADSAEDEEGYALWLEEQAGFLDEPRKRELSVRHRAAWLVRGGADFVEGMRELLKENVTVPEAVRALLRAGRGGGLARELVYLPRWLQCRRRFAEEPVLAGCFERGRFSMAYAESVSKTSLPDSCTVRTGAGPAAFAAGGV